MIRMYFILSVLLLSCTTRYTKREQLPPESIYYEKNNQFLLVVSERWKKYPILASDIDHDAKVDSSLFGKNATIIGEYTKKTTWSDSTRDVAETYCIGEIEGYGYAFVPKHIAEQDSGDASLQVIAEQQRAAIKKNESNLKENDQSLFVAIKSGNYPAMDNAFANGANVNAADKNGVTPLMHAAQRNFSEMVVALLKKGAKIDAKTNAKVTALMMAVGLGHYESAKILIANGANVNLKDENGMTAYDTASLIQRNDLMLLLISAGAKK